MKDKVTIVTGAGGGLRLATARRYLEEGARVVIADVIDTGPAVADLGAADRVLAIHPDVSDEGSVAALTEATLQRFGAIDILVNNAALSSSWTLQPFELITVAEWRRVMDVNLMGTFLCSRAVVTTMKAQGSGVILNFTSGTIYRGTPHNLHYVSSKGGITVLTRALGKELGGAGIRVNALAPGFTLREGMQDNPSYPPAFLDAIVAARAIPSAEYAADVVVSAAFMVSDDAAFVTEQVLTVDGGATFH